MESAVALSPEPPYTAETEILTLSHFTQRAFDFVGASILLLALSPLIGIVWLILKLSSAEPAVFKQKRVTKHGKVFYLNKFRTMRSDAESNGAMFASEDDPRVTPLGRRLRKARIDELPQLLNVLAGEMSLVGPRPERPEMIDSLIKEFPDFRERLKVNAGLTGLAQIAVGYSASARRYRHKLACDRLYIKNRSIMLDLWILWKTIGVVLSGKGAC